MTRPKTKRARHGEAKRKKASTRSTPTGRARIGRRALLIGAAFTLGGIAKLWPVSPGQVAPLEPEPERLSPATLPTSRFFAPTAIPLVLAVADAIVPRYGEHPAASEIDLLPRLDECIDVSSEGGDFYLKYWRRFEAELLATVPSANGRPEPAALSARCESWYEEYYREDAPSLASNYLEGLRRSVLLAYYTLPAGWASVGYAGPAHLRHPMDTDLHV